MTQTDICSLINDEANKRDSRQTAVLFVIVINYNSFNLKKQYIGIPLSTKYS